MSEEKRFSGRMATINCIDRKGEGFFLETIPHLYHKLMMQMATINILKDGTVVEDMSTVKVPREIVISMMKMVMQRKEEKENERSE